MPQLTGGLASVQERVVYPEAAKRAGVQGVALVHFVVDEQGRVACGEVAMAPSAEIGIAAMEAVSHAAFRPGIQDGKPVKVRFMLPIVFRLR